MVGVWETVPTEGIILILEIPEFSQNLVHDKWSIASEPTISRVDSGVSTKHRLATDRQTDAETNSRILFPLRWPRDPSPKLLRLYISNSQSFGNACGNDSHISLLLYCTTHVSHVTTISG